MRPLQHRRAPRLFEVEELQCVHQDMLLQLELVRVPRKDDKTCIDMTWLSANCNAWTLRPSQDAFLSLVEVPVGRKRTVTKKGLRKVGHT